MNVRTALLAVALAAAAPSRALEITLPAGTDAAGLTAGQLDVLARLLGESYCHCGCPHTLAGCLKEHTSCKHAPRMAQLAVKVAGTGQSFAEAKRMLDEYYAGFPKKRAAPNVKDFGPPLGSPDAPVTIVEYSDFTCPFCQAVRPVLERWVKARQGRVKLYYKPFPIPSHERALEAAETAEFAREKGFFWPMHDLLFENGRDPRLLQDADLGRYVRKLGGSPEELARALESKRFRPRIIASQAEARAAGLTGTPTLFFNGRKHGLHVGTRENPLANLEWALDHALADEEEWMKNRGWSRD